MADLETPFCNRNLISSSFPSSLDLPNTPLGRPTIRPLARAAVTPSFVLSEIKSLSFEVAQDSLHASYSFKYFGADKGVSAYTFIDMRNFLYHSLIISAAEHEAHYVIDGLMHNDVVKSDIHSTDTGGYRAAGGLRYGDPPPA